MSETSTKPYLLRAIYEWCTDNGFTPYLAVLVDSTTRVPREFVKNGEIVLNISFSATSGLKMENDIIHFNARFGGVSREIVVPVENVLAIYARENGQGMAFEAPLAPAQIDSSSDSPETLTFKDQPPSLASVPTLKQSDASKLGWHTEEPDDQPDPPKKGNRPTLTRIK